MEPSAQAMYALAQCNDTAMDAATTETRQRAPEAALAAIFTSSARVAVLRVFLLDPTRAYYQRQVETASGQPLRAIQRELDRLTEAGLLYRREEGNRAYYQVDPDFALYPELRALVLKAAPPADVLRSIVALDGAVRLCFLAGDGQHALAVGTGASRPAVPLVKGIAVEALTSDEFIEALRTNRATLDPYLRDGCDLLGRREDVIWRRIDKAGYTVRKGVGVP